MPSTAEDIKGYRRAARKKERANKRMKKKAREALPEKIEPTEPIESLNVKRFVRLFKKTIDEQAAAFKADKKAHWRIPPQLPAYQKTGSKSQSDAQFVYDMHGMLAHFSWKELRRILKTCGVEFEKTKTIFTQSYNAAERALYQALGCEVDDNGVRYKLADRNATLKLWAVEVKERKKMSKDKSGKKGKKNRGDDEETPKKKKKVKAEKEGREEKEPKKEKKEKKSKKAAKLSDESTVSKLKDRPKGGPKTKLLNLIPRKGLSFKKLLSKAKEELGHKADKVTKWVQLMAKNGFIGIE